MTRPLSLLLTLTIATGAAFAQAPSVAIVAAAATGDLTNCRYTDVQGYLQASGQFSSVDVLNCIAQTPTLVDLQGYDAVLTWSNVPYFDEVAVGNVLADYVDAGGGVVVGVFSNVSTGAALRLDGRWRTGGYEVIEAGLDRLSSNASIGTILDPAHPTVQGVSSLRASSAFRPLTSTGLVQGSVIAEWDDGSILVAQGALPNRIDLGLYPPSDQCSSTFWDSTGDGDVLVTNALLAVAGNAGIGTGYCAPNVNSTGQPALMAAAGSRIAVDNDVTLSASSLPSFSFAFFIVSRSQSFVANPGGSSGNLCVGGSVGRYVGPGQVQQSNGPGNIALTIDISQTPQPNGFEAVVSGDTWNFQAWYRDASGGIPTSNFTDGYSINFQ